MATASVVSTKQTTNYARFSRLIIDICGNLLRDVLEKRIPFTTFTHAIRQKKRILLRTLSSEQRQLLFPSSGTFAGTYNDFDVTLLYCLLRNLGNIQPHLKGWGNVPNVSDISLSANIERIRKSRNKIYGHVKSASIEDKVFVSEWSEIKQAVLQIEKDVLTGTKYKEEIEKLKTEEMDPEATSEYSQLLHDMYNREIDTKTILLGHDDHLHEIKSESRMIGSHLRSLDGVLESLLQRHDVPDDIRRRNKAIEKSTHFIKRVLDQSNIVKINAFNVVIKGLQTRGGAVIIGLPGNGKTTLACHVMHEIVDGIHKGMTNKQPLVITKPSDWVDINPYDNFVIFIDNICGTYSLTNAKEWKHILDETLNDLYDLKNESRNLFILALRTEIYRECLPIVKYHPFFQSVIDLTTEENFSRRNKLQILRNCNGIADISITPEKENSIIQTSEIIGFPQCCSLFNNDQIFQKAGVDFFTNPVHFLKTHLEEMSSIENTKFCALAAIVMNGGKMYEEDFEPEKLVQKISAICKTYINVDVGSNIRYYAFSLIGTYLSNIDGIFTFLHDSIHHAVAMVLWEKHKKSLIEQCSIELLAIFESDKTEHDKVLPPKHTYAILANRIIKELSTNTRFSYRNVSEMKMWKDEEFVKAFDSQMVRDKLDLDKGDNENDFSVLFYSVVAKNIHLVTYLLSKSPSQMHLNNALNAACESADSFLFDLFISNNAKITTETVFAVIKGGDPNMFENILKQGVDMFGCCRSKQNEIEHVNIFQEVCLSGNFTFFNVLLHDQNITITQSNEQQLLHYAVQGGSQDMVKCIVEMGSDILQKKDGKTVLHEACYTANLDLVKYFCKIHPVLLKKTSKYNETPLHYMALGAGSVNIATYLINQCVDVSTKDQDGSTVLHYACVKGHLGLVEYLSEHQPMLLEIPGKYNRTALHYTALGTGSVDIATYLIRKGLTVYTKDANDETVLHRACASGHVGLTKYLCDHHPQLLWMTATQNATALHYTTVGTGSVEIVKYLIKKGLNVNATDDRGSTLLHRACYSGHLRLVQYLCYNYPKLLQVKDIYHKTSLHYTAARTGSTDVAKFLVGGGLDVAEVDKNDETVLHIACIKGHLPLVEYLCEHHPVLLQIKGQYRGTPLHYTAWGTGSVDVATYIISKGLDVATKDANDETVLHAACRQGHLDLVEYLCEHHLFFTKITDKCNRTPLHFTAYYTGSVDVAIYLISKGLDVTTQDADDETVLHAACRQGNLDLVEYLCEYHPLLLQILGECGSTALHYAAWGTGSVDVANYLISKGLQVATQDADDETVLHAACRQGHLDLVEYLCESHSALIQITGKYSRTPLHYTAWGTGYVDVATYLIRKGLNVATKDANDETVLHTSCRQGHLDLVKYLCEYHPALIQMTGKCSRTPLHYLALGTGSLELATYLISKDVDVATQDTNDETVLHVACRQGHLDLVEYLYTHYPVLISIKGKCSRTPLHFTAWGTGSVDVATYLITKGFDVATQDADGETVLHTACRQGYLALVEFLCEQHPALLYITGQYRRTPLHYTALGTGSVDVAICLINKGLDVATQDANDETVLHAACRQGHLDLVKYLCEHHPALIQITGKYSKKPLHYTACNTGSVDVVTYLISKGLDVFIDF